MSPRTAAPARRTRLAEHLVALLAASVLFASGLVAGAPAAVAARYTPEPGVTFNNPLGAKPAQRRIATHLISSIQAAPPGATVRVASWEVRARRLVDTLVEAHRRGVTVRVVLDKRNAYAENPNRQVARLQRELRGAGNPERPEPLRSGLTKCKASCRGRVGGIAHSKFVVLSQSGAAQQVVITTSANATVQAATVQWNDAYTIIGDQVVYDAFSSVFDEMYADRPVVPQSRQVTSGATSVVFFPLRGSGAAADPVLRELRAVRCRGAGNTRDGRTEVRFAVTSWHGQRGLAIGQRLRRLSARGCDVRGVYAVAGDRVLRDLRRPGPGAVPVRRIVQNFGPARGYDRYLHAKVLTVRGRQGADRSATVTLTGSANWTPLSLISDEVVLRLSDRATQSRYDRWIAGLFADPPPNPRGNGARGVEIAVN